MLTVCSDRAIRFVDWVGIYSFNKWSWYGVQLAATFADAIVVSINPSHRPEELAYILSRKLEPRYCFCQIPSKVPTFIDIVKKPF